MRHSLQRVLILTIAVIASAIPLAYVGAATNDRAHPLRYLQRYLSDQLHFKIPAPPPAESVATN